MGKGGRQYLKCYGYRTKPTDALNGYFKPNYNLNSLTLRQNFGCRGKNEHHKRPFITEEDHGHRHTYWKNGNAIAKPGVERNSLSEWSK